MEQSIEGLMSEISSRIELLESGLPARVDAMVSPDSKLPFKALIYRAALIWRMAELSRGAFENFEKDRLALAILETRAAVETSAALWYLHAKLDATLKAGAVGDIDDFARRSSRWEAEPIPTSCPQAISVLTFVDRVEKDVEGFRHQYDLLSEFAHPNWAGTALLYSKPDPPNLWTDFGANIRVGDNTTQAGVLNLSVALMLFERNYNRIADIMPAFAGLCKGTLKADYEAGRRRNPLDRPSAASGPWRRRRAYQLIVEGRRHQTQRPCSFPRNGTTRLQAPSAVACGIPAKKGVGCRPRCRRSAPAMWRH